MVLMTRPARAPQVPAGYRRTTVHLRVDQHRALRIRAAELGRDVSSIIRELVDRFLRETEGRKRP
jgi:hypothetical protein